MNILPCVVNEGVVRVDGEPVGRHALANDGHLQLGIRPEFLRLHTAPREAAPKVMIQRHIALGGSAITTVRLGAHDVNVKTEADVPLAAGDERYLEFPAAQTHLYRDGRLLAESA
jgi:glycerol transport system ATP-binding protein